MTQIATLFEELYDLLREPHPDFGRARSLVDSGLRHDPCGSQTKTARKVLSLLLDPLADFYSNNLSRQNEIMALQTVLAKGGGVDVDAFGELIEAWSASSDWSLKPGVGGFGQIIRDQLKTALEWIAARDPGMQKMLLDVDLLDASPAVLLDLFGKMAASSVIQKDAVSDRQEQLWLNALARLAKGLTDIHAASGQQAIRDETDALLQKPFRSGTVRDCAELERQISQHVEIFQREAGSVGGRLADYRQKAEKLKGRIDQLEKDVSEGQVAHFIDPHTGIANRAGFTSHLNRQLERAHHLGEIFSVALIYMENFQVLAAHLHEEESNKWVRSIGEEVGKFLHVGDFLARMTDDRFALIFPKMAEDRCVQVVADIAVALTHTLFGLDSCTVNLEVQIKSVSFKPGMTAAEILNLTSWLADITANNAVSFAEEG